MYQLCCVYFIYHCQLSSHAIYVCTLVCVTEMIYDIIKEILTETATTSLDEICDWKWIQITHLYFTLPHEQYYAFQDISQYCVDFKTEII